MRNHLLLYFFLLIFIVPFLCNCERKDLKRPLKLSLSSDPTSLNPTLVTDVNGGKITCMLFHRLVKFDNDLNIIGDAAKKWSISPDQTKYTFFLKKNLYFSDGSLLTAKDIIKSFEKVLQPQTRSPRSWIFDKVLGAKHFQNDSRRTVEGFKVINDYQLQIILKEPFSAFLSILTMPNACIYKFSSSDPDLLGSGPLMLEKWQHDQIIILKKNPYSTIQTYFSEFHYYIQPEAITRSTSFEMENLDIMDIPESEIIYYNSIKKRRNHIYKFPSLNTYYLGMNCQKGLLQDIKLRQTIARTINPQIIINTIYRNKAIRALGPVPPTLLTNQPPTPKYTDLLTIKEAITLRLLQSKKAENTIVTEVFQNQLKKININIEIVSLEWSSFKENIIAGNFDLFYLSWWADYPSPENFLSPLFASGNHGAGGNYTRIQDKQIDYLLAQANKTLSHSERQKIYSQTVERIYKICPMVFLWHKMDQVITQPYIQGYRPSKVYTIPDILFTYIPKES